MLYFAPAYKILISYTDKTTATDKTASFSAPSNRNHEPRFPDAALKTEEKTLLSEDLVR